MSVLKFETARDRRLRRFVQQWHGLIDQGRMADAQQMMYQLSTEDAADVRKIFKEENDKRRQEHRVMHGPPTKLQALLLKLIDAKMNCDPKAEQLIFEGLDDCEKRELNLMYRGFLRDVSTNQERQDKE